MLIKLSNVSDSASIAEAFHAFNDLFITNAPKITKDIPRQNYSDEASESNVNVNDCSQFSLHPVTLEFVTKEIDHLNKDKATGEDGISCNILKLSKHVIAQSLTDIINKSLIRGVVPCAWKRTRVVHKFHKIFTFHENASSLYFYT